MTNASLLDLIISEDENGIDYSSEACKELFIRAGFEQQYKNKENLDELFLEAYSLIYNRSLLEDCIEIDDIV